MEDRKFKLVGIRKNGVCEERPARKASRRPIASAICLCVIIILCLFAELVMTKDPGYMDLANCSVAPCREFLFGTDTLGRDLFSMIWYGGRVSLAIGFFSTVISTLIAILIGAISGFASDWIDSVLMRFTEIYLSVPSLLMAIFIQAFLGKANVFSISLVIGLTSWPGIAKVVRTEVRQLRSSEFVIASKTMGGSFFHILWRHLAPNFFPSIMFMVVMNIRSAIIAESTLSFMGIGLPIETISWGSMISLAERAMLTKAWWVILVPGIFMVTTIVLITNIGNYIGNSDAKFSSKMHNSSVENIR